MEHNNDLTASDRRILHSCYVHITRLKIIKDFSPQWALLDAAHRAEHFFQVERNALAINKALDLKQKPLLIMLAAYFHDLFTWSRHNHHLLAYEYIMTTDYEHIAKLSPEDRLMVAQACGQHRASRKETTYDCPLAELIASADRDAPDGVDEKIHRAVKYRLHKLKTHIATPDVVKESVLHIKEKFGSEGYAIYPEYYRLYYGDTLAKEQAIIDALDPDTYVL